MAQSRIAALKRPALTCSRLLVRFGAKAMKKSLSPLMVIARAESDSRFKPTAVANWLLLLWGFLWESILFFVDRENEKAV